MRKWQGTLIRTMAGLTLAAVLGGCATIGCELDPLKPKKLLSCEMPLA